MTIVSFEAILNVVTQRLTERAKKINKENKHAIA